MSREFDEITSIVRQLDRIRFLLLEVSGRLMELRSGNWDDSSKE